MAEPLTIQNAKIIAIGDRVWGKGDTIPEALANMRKNGKGNKYVLYLAHPDSGVDQVSGGITYPIDHPPKEIHRVGLKPKPTPKKKPSRQSA